MYENVHMLNLLNVILKIHVCAFNSFDYLLIALHVTLK